MRIQAVIDRDHGLPGNQVHRLAMDSSHRLWLAGSSGLYRFDGSRVRAFDRRDGLRCAGLRTVAIGADDRVWIGTDLGLEAFDRQMHTLPGLTVFDGRFGLVSAIVPDPDELWLATARGLVQILGASRSPRLGQHIDVGYVRELIRLDHRRCLALCEQLGPVVLEDGVCRALPLPPGLAAASIRRVAVVADGRLLLGCDRSLWLIAADRGTPLACLDLPPGAELGALAMRGRQLWVGRGRELICVDLAPAVAAGLTLRSCTPADGVITDLLPDAAGNVWVATDTAGVGRLSGLRMGLQRSLVQWPVYAVRSAAAGRLAVGGDSFFGTVRTATQADGAATDPLTRLASTVWDLVPDDGLDQAGPAGWWLATQHGLYRQLGDAEPQRHSADQASLAEPCRALQAHEGSLWVGTVAGLFRLNDGAAEPVADEHGEPLGYVYTLQVCGQGLLWVGTLGRGLWRQTPAGLKPVLGGPLSASGNTYAVAIGPRAGSGPSRVLVLQDDRVILLDAEKPPRLLASEPPVAGWSAVWLDEHRVAIGCNDGLRIMDCRSGQITQRVNALYGANVWEFTSSRSLLRLDDGSLLCGLVGGLVVVDLAALALHRSPPVARLGDMVWQGTRPRIEQGWTVVAQGKWSLDIEVYAAWLLDEQQQRFRFRLVGFDTDWSASGTLASVRYSSLPPGDYRLQAQATTALTGPGQSAELLRLRVTAPRLGRWLQRAVGAYERLFGLALRNRRLLQRHEELQAEVAARRRVEAELEQHRSRLEQQVLERTRELRLARDEAERANKAKSEFLSRMSHELRTPMNAVLGFAQIMVLDASLSVRHQRYVDETIRAGRHLLSLIDDVLQLSHVESGRLVLLIEPLPLGPLVDECLRMVEPQAGPRRVTLASADLAGMVVMADRTRLRQVLLNLLSNAIKYNREAGRVLVAAQVGGSGGLRISVEDFGLGIATERQAGLFEPFNRLGAEFTNIQGTGIGLAIVRQVVTMMGGTVGAHSQLGVGSQFWIELPTAAREHAASRPPVAVRPGKGPGISQSATLLYVEDNEVNRLLMRELVHRHPGLRLLMAETAQDGLALARRERPDLLLLDLNLPDQDGCSLLAALRADPATANIPALAVTAHAMASERERTRQAGFAEHLVKPLDIAHFDAMLERWLPARGAPGSTGADVGAAADAAAQSGMSSSG